MKFLVEVSDSTTPETMRQLIEAALDDALAEHADVQEYHAPLQTTPTKEHPDADKILNPSMMLFVGGSDRAFRCECGANVFSQKEDEKGVYYECHGCWTVYREGE